MNVSKDSTLDNIFNTVNDSDIVTRVLSQNWKFEILGTTKTLPAITDESKAAFERITGSDYEGNDEYDYTAIATALVDMLTGSDCFKSRTEYYHELQPVIQSVFPDDEAGDIDYSYINSILTCDGTNTEAVTIEELKTLFSTPVNITSIPISKINATLNTGIEYWISKDSYNDECLTNIKVLINKTLSKFLSKSPENMQLCGTLMEVATNGTSAPLLIQHSPEFYLARLGL